MAWVKIPKENHALFYARLPRDKRIQTLQMFGAAAAKVNGHLFGGLFAKSFMVKLGDDDHATALALEGAERFDPMGNGRVMSNTVLMPESLMDEADEMTAWLQKALDYAGTLPPKAAKPAKATPASSPSATPAKAPPAKAKPTTKATLATNAKTATAKAKPATKPATKPKTAAKAKAAAKAKTAAKATPATKSAAKAKAATKATSKASPTKRR